MPIVLTEYIIEQLAADLIAGAAFTPAALPSLFLWWEPAKQGVGDGVDLPTIVDYSGNSNTGTITGLLPYQASSLSANFAGGSVKAVSPSVFDASYNGAFTIFSVVKGNNSGLTVDQAIGAGFYMDRNSNQAGYELGGTSVGSLLRPVTQQLIAEWVRYDGATLTVGGEGFGYQHGAASGSMGFSGVPLTWGQLSGSFQFLGQISLTVVCKAALSDVQIRQLLNYVGRAQTKQVICDGNSLTVGAAGIPGWPFPAFDALAAGYGGYDVATAGITLPSLISRYAALVPPLFAAGLDNIVTVQEIVNTLADDTVSAATCEGYLAAYATVARASGAKVVAATALPATSSGIVNPVSYEAKRQAVNTWMRGAGLSNFDALADVGGDATIGAPGASTNATYYQSDQIHLTLAGQAIQAGIFQPAILSV